MDSFEVRIQFTTRLKKLGASRDSILRVANFALENVEHHEDLFNCMVEQLKSTSVRNRLNLLGLIDTLCQLPQNSTVIGGSTVVTEAGLPTKGETADSTVNQPNKPDESSTKRKLSTKELSPLEPTTTTSIELNLPTATDNSHNPYLRLVQNNIALIFEHAVPNDSNGALNLSGARKVLSSWRSKAIFPVDLIDTTELTLKNHQFDDGQEPTFSRSEIFRRIEEDRERHKRMKEENWLQPVDPADRQEFQELYSCLHPPPLPTLLDTLDQLHAKFLYDTTSLGKLT